ncbi:MAG: GntR family transcriptional regulator [Anaerovoracaceae bacterium]
MEWQFKTGTPIYTQIIDQLKINIANGAYAPGEKIPSVRDLALDAAVNPNTMQRALSELERDGLIYTVRTSGRFITDEKENLVHLKQSLAHNYAIEFVNKLEGLGMKKEEVLNVVRSYYEEENK